jgi:hypothetical protein
LFISEAVFEEVSAGDADEAKRRRELIAPITWLEITGEVGSLATALVSGLHLPKKAETDAVHMAVCAVNGVDYLVTWNCTHIANAILRPKIEAICRDAGFEPPIICTLQELLEADDGMA